MSREKPPHPVIIVSGLGDNVKLLELATHRLSVYELKPVIFRVGWEEESDLQSKIDGLNKYAHVLREIYGQVSAIGISAGSSLIFAAGGIDRYTTVTNVAGRVFKGPMQGLRGFNHATRSSTIFRQSVSESERQIQALDHKLMSRIQTFRGIYDEVVPPETTRIDGASNNLYPTIGHVPTIASVLLFSRRLPPFITGSIHDSSSHET